MILKKVGGKVRQLMNEKLETCTEILSCAQKRLILGLIFVGLGGGLIASAYVKTP